MSYTVGHAAPCNKQFEALAYQDTVLTQHKQRKCERARLKWALSPRTLF